MFPEYSDKKFLISFVIPISLAIFSTLARIYFPSSFGMTLVIISLETFFFWGLLVILVELFMFLNVTERESEVKLMGFYSNIVIIPMFLTGVLLPVIRNVRNGLFPDQNDWNTITALSTDLTYQFYVLLPNVIAIITVILIILLLAIAVHEAHEVEYLKAIIFSTAIGILAFTVSTVLAGLPFGMV